MLRRLLVAAVLGDLRSVGNKKETYVGLARTIHL